MRKNIRAIFVISALVALVLCSACVLPQSGKPPVNNGISQITTQEISNYISFEEVKQKYEDYSSVNGSAEKLPVYYIFSRDIDNSGNATSWLFGVRQSTGTEVLMYDRAGWKIIPWNATLPPEEIILNQVVSPNTLFIKNKEVIFGASSPSIQERRDLVLKQGVYTLTITSENSSRVLSFNAISGALITKV
jgi:hypothetical protein